MPDAHFVLVLLGGSLASIAVFELCVLLYKKVKTPLLNPLLVTLIGLMLALSAFNIPLESYEESVSLFSFLLGPATVALAYSVYKQRQILKEHFVPIVAGCLVGSVVSMVSAYGLCKLLGLGNDMALSFVPKSVTTPIAIAASQELGGITSITVAAVIITGILGAIFSPTMAKVFRVKSSIAKGVAIGACSHAVGTTKAIEMGELEGAMSGVALAVSGILTTIIVIVAHCVLQG
ncbi:MAG: LrgB family protein [Coriobacteriaceae bacterium]|nr:LrgB family protein [Coriobacteriaceae bacterium]